MAMIMDYRLWGKGKGHRHRRWAVTRQEAQWNGDLSGVDELPNLEDWRKWWPKSRKLYTEFTISTKDSDSC